MWHNIEYSDKPLSLTAFGRRVTLLTSIRSKPHGKNRRKTYIGLGMKDDFRTILKEIKITKRRNSWCAKDYSPFLPLCYLTGDSLALKNSYRIFALRVI